MHRHSETLARIGVFKDLDSDEINRLDTQCAWRRVDAGSEILSHLDTSSDVYFVAAGTVRVVISSIRGRETVFRDIHEGEFFGELSAIDAKERSASIVAVTNATIARMPAHIFCDLARSHGPVCYRILKRAVAQIRYLSERINEFRMLDVRHRIYAELIRLSQDRGKKGDEGVISPPPPHQDIADRICSRREAVTRELKNLERDGLLHRRRGALVLTDVDALTKRVRHALMGDD
jgi:CRP/FNR family transcriptional regulator, cyclic AMP receptor protein